MCLGGVDGDTGGSPHQRDAQAAAARRLQRCTHACAPHSSPSGWSGTPTSPYPSPAPTSPETVLDCARGAHAPPEVIRSLPRVAPHPPVHTVWPELLSGLGVRDHFSELGRAWEFPKGRGGGGVAGAPTRQQQRAGALAGALAWQPQSFQRGRGSPLRREAPSFWGAQPHRAATAAATLAAPRGCAALLGGSPSQRQEGALTYHHAHTTFAWFGFLISTKQHYVFLVRGLPFWYILQLSLCFAPLTPRRGECNSQSGPTTPRSRPSPAIAPPN